uniref:A to I editase domain-containing protein n=1 Tax=Sander lucioperca TaxID=283035 RepID=A0A8C9Y0J4_SANLU
MLCFYKKRIVTAPMRQIGGQSGKGNRITNTEACQPGKAPNFSMNRTLGDPGLEVINATTGKDDLGRPSANTLCSAAGCASTASCHPAFGSEQCGLAATRRRSAKQTLFRAFHTAGLGTWVKKPVETDQFALAD